MTYSEAMEIEIGDTLIAGWTSTDYQKNDELILIARARDYNGLSNDTGGDFYNLRTKDIIGGDIQHFTLKQHPL